MPDDEQPWGVTKTTLVCPFGDGVLLAVELGWVSGPTIHLNFPQESMDHIQEHDGE